MPKLLTCLFIGLCSLSASFAQKISPLPYYDSAWSKPYEPFRIAGNLYYVGTYDLACYLITTSQGNILINTGLAESTSQIQKNIETLGFNFSDIKILLTTQVHYDHVAALAEIKKITGASTMVHHADVKVLEDGGNSDFVWGGKGSTFAPVKVDSSLNDGDVIKLGETKLIAHHHPGHTKGATSFEVQVKDDNRTWNVLIVNMPTILSQTRIFGMPSYPNVGQDYQYTLQSLKKLKFDLWVASHASQFNLHNKRKPGDTYNPEAFKDQAGYQASINELQADYDRRMRAK